MYLDNLRNENNKSLEKIQAAIDILQIHMIAYAKVNNNPKYKAIKLCAISDHLDSILTQLDNINDMLI